MISDDLLFAPMRVLARRIKQRTLSPVRLAESYLGRIEKVAPQLHAFVTVTADLALRQARQAEKEINAGLYRGPLHGIPYGAKDLFAVKGYPTTWGAQPYQHQVIDIDAAAIRRLQKAGAVLLGKLAMSEIAGGPPSASATGPCRNPWDLNRWSGGSSGGSGAAVAAGLVAFALGTETRRSIMIPSSFCGVTGLRPTFGRISRAGTMALCWTMDKVGVLARTAMDCATVFALLNGRDPDDAMTRDAPFKTRFTKAAARVSQLRIGFVKEDYDTWGEPEVGRAFAETVKTFQIHGVQPVEMRLPDYPYETVAETIIAAEQASAFEPLVRSGKVGEIIDSNRRGELLGGHLVTAVDYLRCQRARTLIARDYASVFENYDIILGSSTLNCAPPIDADIHDIFVGGNIIEAAENLLGLPAVSIPCGFNSRKLPIGLKIIGRPFGEADVLETAHLYQSFTDWHLKRPEL
jgi:aspartyl-tRNA(Asn)/glutamyl-tRNA(Gln) amidotransferase subunit A